MYKNHDVWYNIHMMKYRITTEGTFRRTADVYANSVDDAIEQAKNNLGDDVEIIAKDIPEVIEIVECEDPTCQTC
jgi:hypothetical protein